MLALHESIRAGNDIQRFRELLAGGELVNSQDDFGRTPLHVAIMKSERRPQDIGEIFIVVRELINSGADVNLGDNMGITSLHMAIRSRNCEMVQMLLQANADVNKTDRDGWAALHFATFRFSCYRVDGTLPYNPELGVVRLLFRYNPDIDIRNAAGETPLMLAARSNNLDIVRELLKRNASVNLKDSSGDTALHCALNNSEVDVELVLTLSRHECDFYVTNNSGMTPQDSYFNNLLVNHPRAEVEKAKIVIKLFMLKGYHFNDLEENCIRKISKANKRCKLARFLNLCYKEILKMHNDKLTPRYSVYAIAFRGAFCKPSENYNQIPVVVIDKILDKVIKLEYPAYYDIIAAAIFRPYMKTKFAEMCCNVKTGIELFDFDVLSLLSPYLSNLDMLNTMIACTPVEESSSFLSRFTYFRRCSVS